MLTDYFGNKILDTVRGSANVTLDTIYIGLSTTTPNSAKGENNWNFTEPSGNGYSRQMIGTKNQSASYAMGEANGKASTNVKQIAFEQATGAWGTLTYAGIFDAATGGNLLWFGALTASIAPTTGHIAVIAAGDLDLSVT